MTSVEQQLKLPVDPQRLTTSSLVFGARLLENSSPQFQIAQTDNDRDQKISIASPLKIGDKEIVPLTDRVFARADQFYVLFYAYHAGIGAGARPQVKVSASVWDAGGNKLSDAAPVEFSDVDPLSQGVPCHVRFPLRDFPPGKYLLKLTALDEVSRAQVGLEEQFEVR